MTPAGFHGGSPLGEDPVGAGLPGFVLGELGIHSERPALIDGPSGRSLSYGQLAQAVQALSRGLAARGYGLGHTLALGLDNQPEFAAVLYGALAAGLRVALIDPHRPGQELRRQVQAAGTDLLVQAPGFGPISARTPEEAWEQLLLLGDAETTGPLAELIGGATSEPEPPAGPDQAALVGFTAGTAGPARGVLLSHGNLIAGVRQLQARLPLDASDVIVAAAPWRRPSALSAVLNAGLRARTTLVTVPDLELAPYIELSSRYRATRAYAPASLIDAIVHARNVPVWGLSSLELVVSLAEPLPTDLQQDCQNRLDCPVIGTYGMTELSGIALAEAPSGVRWPGRVGRPLPGTDCRLVDPGSGREASRGQPGELWVRGPQVMLGYLGDWAGTRDRIDRRRWLHTGDLARLTPDGNVQILGRIEAPGPRPPTRRRGLTAVLRRRGSSRARRH